MVERTGLRSSARKLLRRAWFLYAVHIALAVTIMVVHGWNVASAEATPTWRQAGGLGQIRVSAQHPLHEVPRQLGVALLVRGDLQQGGPDGRVVAALGSLGRGRDQS